MTLGLMGPAIDKSFRHHVLCLSQNAQFCPVKLSCMPPKQWRETSAVGDYSVRNMSRHMLDRPWNAQHANLRGALQDVEVSYMKNIISENRSPCTSYTPGSVTVETGQGFNDHGCGSLLQNGICVLAMRGVSHFSGLALMLRLTLNNVHRKFQRLTTNTRCHRENNKPTGNPQKWVVMS